MSEKELPAGWVRTTLGEVARWGSGGTPKSGVAEYYGGNIPWVVSGDLGDQPVTSAALTITPEGLNSSSAKWVPEGSVLVAMYGATVGKLGIAKITLTTNQAVAFAEPIDRLADCRFLFWYLRSQRDSLRKIAKGGAQSNISQTILKAWPIALPPIAEQCRIVEELEGCLSRLDVAADGVARSAKRSEHLWSAVLNFVARGAIGEVLTAVRSVAVSDIAEVSGGIQKQQKRKPVDNAYPFLRVANVGRGSLELGNIHKIELFDGELAKHRLIRGDLLVVEGNGSPDQIGRAAMWAGGINDAVHQNHLIRVRPGPRLNPRYLELIWNAPVVTDQLREVARSTSGLYTLSTSKVKSVRIPVPSLVEQEQLVEAAETWETHIATAKTTLTIADQKGSSLRRAILNRAFTGALVPQDPTDEPASALLARIQAERAAQPKAKRPRRAATTPRTAKRAPAAAPTESAPAPSPTAAPAHAVQQEFDL